MQKKKYSQTTYHTKMANQTGICTRSDSGLRERKHEMILVTDTFGHQFMTCKQCGSTALKMKHYKVTKFSELEKSTTK